MISPLLWKNIMEICIACLPKINATLTPLVVHCQHHLFHLKLESMISNLPCIFQLINRQWEFQEICLWPKQNNLIHLQFVTYQFSDRILHLLLNGLWEPCFSKNTIWFWIKLQRMKWDWIISKLVLLSELLLWMTLKINILHPKTNYTQHNLKVKIVPTPWTESQIFILIQIHQFL